VLWRNSWSWMRYSKGGRRQEKEYVHHYKFEHKITQLVLWDLMSPIRLSLRQKRTRKRSKTRR
jgi:hypothetical protein